MTAISTAKIFLWVLYRSLSFQDPSLLRGSHNRKNRLAMDFHRNRGWKVGTGSPGG
jgi:hypothetical protein